LENEKREREEVLYTAPCVLALETYVSVKMWRREGMESLRYKGEIEKMSLILNIANDLDDEFGGKVESEARILVKVQVVICKIVDAESRSSAG